MTFKAISMIITGPAIEADKCTLYAQTGLHVMAPAGILQENGSSHWLWFSA